jgi:aldehyde dehydrogenase (NAD+)
MGQALRVGDPLDPATLMGPVVSETAMERIRGVIERANADESELLVGGRVVRRSDRLR